MKYEFCSTVYFTLSKKRLSEKKSEYDRHDHQKRSLAMEEKKEGSKDGGVSKEERLHRIGKNLNT